MLVLPVSEEARAALFARVPYQAVLLWRAEPHFAECGIGI